MCGGRSCYQTRCHRRIQSKPKLYFVQLAVVDDSECMRTNGWNDGIAEFAGLENADLENDGLENDRLESG